MPARTVPFNLFDRPRMLKFDVNALSDLEMHFGTNPIEMLQRPNVGPATLRGFLWAGLKWGDRSLTIERTGDLLQTYMELPDANPANLLGPILEALTASKLIRTAEAPDDPISGETKPTTILAPEVSQSEPSENGSTPPSP